MTGSCTCGLSVITGLAEAVDEASAVEVPEGTEHAVSPASVPSEITATVAAMRMGKDMMTPVVDV